MASIDYPPFSLLFPVNDWLEWLVAKYFEVAVTEVSVGSITQLKLDRDQEHEKIVVKHKEMAIPHSISFSE